MLQVLPMLGARAPSQPALSERAGTPVGLLNLAPLMERSKGRPEVVVGLVDGPVDIEHPDLLSSQVVDLAAGSVGGCATRGSYACQHGTFVAGILSARRDSAAPGICPGCVLLVSPIFGETTPDDGGRPAATPDELSSAIHTCLDAGARILNLSAALIQTDQWDLRSVEEALDRAAGLGALVVVAAGNRGAVARTPVTSHEVTIPVVACGLDARPSSLSNLGGAIARKGVMAPGEYVVSLGTTGRTVALSGTSAAAPFVTGTLALLWSLLPSARSHELSYAVTATGRHRRTYLVPPLLDAGAAYYLLNDHMLR